MQIYFIVLSKFSLFSVIIVSGLCIKYSLENQTFMLGYAPTLANSSLTAEFEAIGMALAQCNYNHLQMNMIPLDCLAGIQLL